MLPPFIIDQIRQREQREQALREDAARPRVELPMPPSKSLVETDEAEDDGRGFVIVDLGS